MYSRYSRSNSDSLNTWQIEKCVPETAAMAPIAMAPLICRACWAAGGICIPVPNTVITQLMLYYVTMHVDWYYVITHEAYWYYDTFSRRFCPNLLTISRYIYHKKWQKYISVGTVKMFIEQVQVLTNRLARPTYSPYTAVIANYCRFYTIKYYITLIILL